ncbi:MAG: hypothetical protein GXP53_06735 [Deltaproteobacteria bacterium]|nr:hypothetical protein [Deltaproteobacteria bacterium]
MIDLHCHILPGIDDGASGIQASIEMARIAANDGIQKIVATPHIKDNQYSAQSIADKTLSLNQELRDLGISVEIVPGAEISSLLPVSIIKAFTLNRTPYILLDFPVDYVPINSKELFFELLVNGLKPIIAHPERNQSIIRDPEKLFSLLDTNVHVQITAGSLTGLFGREIKKCAIHLLKKGVVDVMASDAHTPTHRRPILSNALKKAEKIIGTQKARDLVFKNPTAIIEGNKL